MDILGAIVAGLIGTLVFTIFMRLGPMMGIPRMNIIRMLGTMFTADVQTANLIGGVIHFINGAVFAIIYALLWAFVVRGPTWWWGIIFGAVHGLVIMLIMPVVLQMHPRPPEMERGPQMIGGMLLGHMVFGLVVALVYGLFV